MKPTKVSGLLPLQAPTQTLGTLVTHTNAKETYLTIQEAADLLRVSTRTLIRWNKKGELPMAKIGNVVLYPLTLMQETIRSRAEAHLRSKDW